MSDLKNRPREIEKTNKHDRKTKKYTYNNTQQDLLGIIQNKAYVLNICGV